MKAKSDTVWLEARAKELGFSLCGVVAPAIFTELAHTEEWLARGFAGEMNYLADPRRRDVQRVLPGIRSIIVCALNYNSAVPSSVDVTHLPVDSEPRGWISRYAWGADYHLVLQELLSQLTSALRRRFDEPFDARIYADTGPLHERIFAKYAGLGWLGKNTLLLNQRLGSLFFLGTILTTLEFAPSLDATALPPPDLCGSCRKCIDACPTGAFVEPYVMDARRCISYHTIELRSPIPEEFREPLGVHVFGCDICQDVCPWNRRAPVTTLPQFQPRVFSANEIDEVEQSNSECAPQTLTAPEKSLFSPHLEWLASLDEPEFRRVFRGSAIKRTKWRGLIRNACVALGNSALHHSMPAYERIVALLQRLSSSQDPVIAESALWALSRIQ